MHVRGAALYRTSDIIAANAYAFAVNKMWMLSIHILFIWWWNREFVSRYIDPFVPLLDQHDGDIIPDWVFPRAILTNKPYLFCQL